MAEIPDSDIQSPGLLFVYTPCLTRVWYSTANAELTLSKIQRGRREHTSIPESDIESKSMVFSLA